jgi:hypothetical protein
MPGTSGGGPRITTDNDNDGAKRKLDSGSSTPGSKSNLGKRLTPSELFFSGVVFNTDNIASHYSMANKDHTCWPVLLSKKSGNAALEVCPDHKAHGNMKQACHKRPAKFDIDYIYKHFARAPTADEKKQANWNQAKGKGKKKAKN